MKYLLSGWARYVYDGCVIMRYCDSEVEYTDTFTGSVIAINADDAKTKLCRKYILETGLSARTKVTLPDIISVKELSHGRLHTKLQEI